MSYFNETHAMVRETARRFVEQEVKPDIDAWEEAGSFPREVYNSRWAKDHAAFYRVTADSVRPRYAIPVARLQQRLKDLPLAVADFSCRTPYSLP